ncbi:MAG TPA: metal-dependent hydrolase [Candidatus Tectomicrobia bacterium]
MQTQTHVLLAAALVVPLRRRHMTVHTPAVVIGAVLPDLPFFLLTVAGEIYYRWFAPLPATTGIMEYLHFTLFYRDPLWIVGHNLFHSLVVDTLLLCLGLWGMRRKRSWGAALFWLAASMLLHVGIDIVTHRSDGPLLWFPLSWTYRFASPVSYWESAYFGRWFMVFEYTLDLILAALLAATYRPLLHRWRSR